MYRVKNHDKVKGRVELRYSLSGCFCEPMELSARLRTMCSKYYKTLGKQINFRTVWVKFNTYDTDEVLEPSSN